jgi:methionyl-tRNA formyltransferase
MRIVFFGTPNLAVPTLRALVDAGHDIALVVTQPDRRRGRGTTTTPSPVKAAAEELGLPVSHRVADALDADVELGVLVAFGRIIKPEILDALRIINLHPSLLPRWRGATPAEAAILAGDERTGISIMQLGNEMDAGPVYGTYETRIDPTETAMQLYDRLIFEGNRMLLDMLAHGLPVPVPQQGEPTYCGKLSPEDFHIDWSCSADQIIRLTRIGRPWTTIGGKRLLVLEANQVADLEATTGHEADRESGTLVGTVVQCGTGALELRTVQPEGKRRLDAEDWRRGVPPDARLV